MMRPPVDMRLKPYGMVLPLMVTDMRKHRRAVWYCLCKCGKLFYRASDEIKNSSNKACGCQQKITGRKITNLKNKPCNNDMVLPLMRTNRRYKGAAVWYCLCKCGRLFYRSIRELRNNKIKSCGCKRSGYANFSKITDPSSALTLLCKIKIGKKQCLVCRCECGNTKTFYFYDILHGRSKSCGCMIHLKKDKANKE